METTHARSRRAALIGLVLQLIAFAVTLGVGIATHSLAIQAIGWFTLGGAVIWFGALLVYRQRELAALEKMDLELLARERADTGGGDLMFAEEGAESGFRVAEARLRWMQRWVLPVLSLALVTYLAATGLVLWFGLPNYQEYGFEQLGWPTVDHIPLGLILLGVLTLLTFLYARYAAGLGRIAEWQLLRGGGSFLLANTLAIFAAVVCLGVLQYSGASKALHVLAYVVPIAMVVVAAEVLLNWVLDIYRPRIAGQEPRAAFDSRLLALIAQPEGVASSIAEALNYQFGFRVSQTWFYQLLQRAFLPLVGVAAATLWLLTCIVVVAPGEQVVIERFGRQKNVESPMTPGTYFKLPWPIEVAQRYDVDVIHEIHIGYRDFDADVPVDEFDASRPHVPVLWTDEKHRGLPHFDFVILPEKTPAARQASEAMGADVTEFESREETEAVPVNLVRMEVVVQYRIAPDGLPAYTQKMADADQMVRELAWDETVRYSASSTIDELLGDRRNKMGDWLKQQLADRVSELGLEIVHVSVGNVHPAKTVAEAFREVIKAELDRGTALRKAIVEQNQKLTRVAGEKALALALSAAIDNAREADVLLNQAETQLDGVPDAAVEKAMERLAPAEKPFQARVEARYRLDRARERLETIQRDIDLGIGRKISELQEAQAAVNEAEQALDRLDASLNDAFAAAQKDLAGTLTPEAFEGVVARLKARLALSFWNERLEALLRGLGGEAAVKLEEAQAKRWQQEMKVAGELARFQNEVAAYEAAPSTYRLRKYLDVLVDGIKDSRKYFLAFLPNGRKVHVRMETQEETRTDYLNLSDQAARESAGGR